MQLCLDGHLSSKAINRNVSVLSRLVRSVTLLASRLLLEGLRISAAGLPKQGKESARVMPPQLGPFALGVGRPEQHAASPTSAAPPESDVGCDMIVGCLPPHHVSGSRPNIVKVLTEPASERRVPQATTEHCG